ncbi:MAG: hypothetical protein M1374_00310 [Firmicutes bacterium]|jgi:fructose-1,6-bisphosphatase/inositol monophosphatase family enzyme|nr:hypothetical protein [Bacillota bacterium]
MLTKEDLIAVASNVTGAIRDQLDRITDWDQPGNRAGQYLIDLVADKAALDYLSYANFSVLSEESGLSKGNNGFLAIIDPIDGSTNASRRLPWYAVSICFLGESGIMAARVENLMIPVIFEALEGGGATFNGKQIAVDKSKQLSSSIVAVSSLPPPGMAAWQFRCYGAASLDLCCVANSTFDAYVDYGENAHGVWDYLAGVFIAQEAGAMVGEVWNRSLVTTEHSARRTPIAACSKEIFDAMMEHRKYGKH